MALMNRKFTDIFFKYLFRIVAFTSALALGAILIFVFAQGTMPFFTAAADNIRLVARNINDLTVNDTLYLNHREFIHIPDNITLINISFPAGDKIETLEIIYDTAQRDPAQRLIFNASGEIEVSIPEAYVFTVRWPGGPPAFVPNLHIIIPEPPYSFISFITGLRWSPARDKVYGILPMIVGTLMAGLGAMLLGVPIALLTALFMAEFLKPKMATIVRGGVELLAGIPSVVYGFFGLMVIVPFIRSTFNLAHGTTMLSAIIVLSLMILPTVITIAETSLRAVPLSVREASLALGASKMQTSWKVVLPHANSGVIAGIILGISRAVGEAMAVIMVAGNSPHLTFHPLESVRTLTATIAMEMGYAAGRHSEILFSIGVTLFIMILILNSFILWFRRRMETEL